MDSFDLAGDSPGDISGDLPGDVAGELSGRRVLVTGGSGFIGRRVVADVHAAGATVVVADRQPLPAGVADAVDHLVSGDLRDPEVRHRAVDDDLDAIVHLAALTSVLESVQRPAEFHDANVTVTAGLLEEARTAGVARFALASSNAVAGDVGHATIDEDLALAPLTPYGATKAAAEMLLSGYRGSLGVSTVALRLTNVYGPGMQAKDSFVPRLMRAAAAGEGVEVYGDGEQRRDFVHVADVARAFCWALATDVVGPVVIGAGHSPSVNDLVATAREVTGAAIPATHVPARPGEMPAVIVDPSHARRLGWEATWTLADGLASVWDEFRPDAGVA